MSAGNTASMQIGSFIWHPFDASLHGQRPSATKRNVVSPRQPILATASESGEPCRMGQIRGALLERHVCTSAPHLLAPCAARIWGDICLSRIPASVTFTTRANLTAGRAYQPSSRIFRGTKAFYR